MSPETLARVMDVHEALESFGGYSEWWSGAMQITFSQRVLGLGKPLREVTVGELQDIAAEVSKEMKGCVRRHV
ncbi:hypothetical protein C0053_34095 [Pseudomonas aeruginosa]|uniref:hypothetical protein n=1 Tax=Pseudomonas aeruginosa TaxID=287 RepID=UPI00035C2793|nr:hypothetical protein [Pseudomonas aeruginosa]ESR73135.1 hypothetical protein T266_00280 [Pseudomonas aeruginosa VRFPA05]MDG0899170.1 hypothetical protein [Pseudomonas sp. L01]EIU2699044.1 hypothetical protein [Pseudomonas aeruginosa]EJV1365815.1 hypothetical protein [Pseudomonas aeruginosa]EJV1383427.1 hypothetical protein [Pseudomonas aeruginosa]